MNISEYIVNFLSKKGIKDVFSIVGGHSLFINKAFHDHPDYKVTYMHHEQTASMAADAYFRLKKIPAIVNISAGPASLNTLNGLYGSYVDSIPTIYISGQPKLNQQVSHTGLSLRQFGDQEFDKISELVKEITKYSIKLTNASDVEYELEKAYLFATGGRPGPVWIDIPMDIQNKQFVKKESTQLIKKDTNQNISVFLKKVTTKQLEIISEKIRSAKRPIIYAGPNIRTYDAYDEFKEFIEKLKIPVVTSWNAHDLIETDNPLFVGRPGLRGERCGNWAVYSSDLILIIGEHLSIRQIGYIEDNYAPNALKIMIDQDNLELHKPTINIDLVICASVKDFISKLTKFINYKPDIYRDNWQKRTREIWDKYKPSRSNYNSNKDLNPYHFLFDLFDLLNGEETIIIGNGISVVGAFQVAKIKGNQQMFQNYGCASMGYDLPGIIGSWLGKKRKNICLTGDGSIQLNLQELQTIKSLNINAVIFVINNGGYDSIRQSQQTVFGQDSSLHGINQETGLTFPDLEKISNAYDFKYISINSLENCKVGITSALNQTQCICEIFVDKTQNFEPKVSTFKNKDGSISSGELTNMKPFFNKEEIEKILKFLID